MTAVLICTHGNTGAEMIKSAEMICGEQDNCDAVPFLMGQSLDELRTTLKNTVEQYKTDEAVICLTDLKGGTPFNTLVALSESHANMTVITGINIPMLLQLLVYRNQLSEDELIDDIITTGKEGIFKFEVTDVEDDDF